MRPKRYPYTPKRPADKLVIKSQNEKVKIDLNEGIIHFQR